MHAIDVKKAFSKDGESWKSPTEGVWLPMVNRGDSPFTIGNETASFHFLKHILPQSLQFTGDAIQEHVQKGKYPNTRAERKAKGQLPGTENLRSPGLIHKS